MSLTASENWGTFLDDTGEGGTTAASATSIHSSRHVCKYHIYIFIIYNGPGYVEGQHFIERGSQWKWAKKWDEREIEKKKDAEVQGQTLKTLVHVHTALYPTTFRLIMFQLLTTGLFSAGWPMADTALAHRSFEGGCRVCKLVPGPCAVSSLWSHIELWPGIDFNLPGRRFYQKVRDKVWSFVVCKKWMVKLLDVKKVDAAGGGVAIHRGGMKKWLKRPGWLFHRRLLSSEMDTEMMSDIQRKARPLPAASAAWMAAISFPVNRRKWDYCSDTFLNSFNILICWTILALNEFFGGMLWSYLKLRIKRILKDLWQLFGWQCRSSFGVWKSADERRSRTTRWRRTNQADETRPTYLLQRDAIKADGVRILSVTCHAHWLIHAPANSHVYGSCSEGGGGKERNQRPLSSFRIDYTRQRVHCIE
jgi:hypothetical protein